MISLPFWTALVVSSADCLGFTTFCEGATTGFGVLLDEYFDDVFLVVLDLGDVVVEAVFDDVLLVEAVVVFFFVAVPLDAGFDADVGGLGWMNCAAA